MWPAHTNVGDHLIWLAQKTWLDEHGYEVGYWSSDTTLSLEALANRVGEAGLGAILLGGGGNLGDVYPAQQTLRESVISRCTEVPIVQLPQSVHFDDPANAVRFTEVASGHSDLTVMVRDLASMSALEGEAVLAPDMAFAIRPSPPRPAPSRTVFLLRGIDDAEKATRSERLPAEAVDWHPMTGRRTGQARVTASAVARLALKPVSPPDRRWSLRHQIALRHSRNEVDRGVATIQAGDVLVTDRLHGLILAVLLRTPVVGLDNRYGKLSAFVKTWLSEHPFVAMAEDLEAAEEVAARFRAAAR